MYERKTETDELGTSPYDMESLQSVHVQAGLRLRMKLK